MAYKTNQNLPQRIREMQRDNERELLAHLRDRLKAGDPVRSITLFGNAWVAALERLTAAGKVVYTKPRGRFVGYYKAVRNARPVTNAR